MKPSRRLRRFFSPFPLSQVGQVIFLPQKETRHLKKTLRLDVGDDCLLTDGSGREAKARVEDFSSAGESYLRVEELVTGKDPERYFKLFFYVALPQREKMDFLVQKAQEWGVEQLCPVRTKRTVVRMTEANRQKVLQRWNKIAREASKQSGSLRLLNVREPASFQAALEGLGAGQKAVIFHPADGAVPFRDWIRMLQKDFESDTPSLGADGPVPDRVLHLFLGPEGGFSDDEVRSAVSRGAIVVSLGRSILKVDTAFLGILSTVRLLFP